MNIFNTQANIFKVNGGIADVIANRPMPTNSFYIFWATDTGEIFYDNGTWIQFGSGGGGGFYFAVTLAQLVASIAANLLVPGAVYFITDRNYFFTATTNNTIATTGARLQSVPYTYLDGAVHNGATWYGIFYVNVPASINDRCIWGSKVWINLAGTANLSPVDDFTLDPAEWVISNDANDYLLLSFAIEYDLQNDWIAKQMDQYNNIVGITYYTAQDFGLSYNPVNVTDWNLQTIIPGITAYGNNIVNFGFYNNRAYLANNVCGRWIKNNTGSLPFNIAGIRDNNMPQDGGIENNAVDTISFNNSVGIVNNIGNSIFYNHVYFIGYNTVTNTIERNTMPNNVIANNNTPTISYNSCGDILDNFVTNFISYNKTIGQISLNTVTHIHYNTIPGEIFNNNFLGFIEYNTNAGSINGNGGNITAIYSNSNNGNILENYISGVIHRNSNGGNINQNQINVTIIEQNSNNGNISQNNNTGAIQHNSNTGNISNNTCLAITNNYCGGNLSNNSNTGNISSNNIGGPITGNSNGGAIFQNSNAAGIQNNSNTSQIYRNQNNGQILGITNITAQIFSNVNNGDITTSTPGNITDPVVNK